MTARTIREPIVSGRFYTSNRSELKKQVSGFVVPCKEKIDAFGVVAPHAGFSCSGVVAGAVFASIEPRPTYVILGPNHTGQGRPFGLDPDRIWKTPLGEVKVDTNLAQKILKRSNYIKKDYLCHDREHSIEVQLPFLQHLSNDFTVVPIVVSSGARKSYGVIAGELADVIKQEKKKILIIATSDMSHYLPEEEAKKQDQLAIKKILALDIDGFLSTIERYNISMCGFAPTAIMLGACCKLGATKTKLIRYNTSGDTCGDRAQVVGYAGITVY